MPVAPFLYVTRVWRRIRIEHLQLLDVVWATAWLVPRCYAAFTSTSVGLIADAVSLVVELAFGLLVYLAYRAARRSCPLLFPYGAGKFEAIANSLLGMSLLVSGVGIVSAGVMRFADPVTPENTTNGLILLAISTVYIAVLLAASAHLRRSDSIVVKLWRRSVLLDLILKAATIAMVLAASTLGGIFVYGDALAAILIGFAMLALAVRTLRDTVWELSDRALEEGAQLLVLKGLSERFEDFDDLIDIRTRRIGGRPIIEVALGFNETRGWQQVVGTCAKLRETLERHLDGAEIVVWPTSRTLFQPPHARDAAPRGG